MAFSFWVFIFSSLFCRSSSCTFLHILIFSCILVKFTTLCIVLFWVCPYFLSSFLPLYAVFFLGFFSPFFSLYLCMLGFFWVLSPFFLPIPLYAVFLGVFSLFSFFLHVLLYVGFKCPGVPAGGKKYKGKYPVLLDFSFLVGISDNTEVASAVKRNGGNMSSKRTMHLGISA